MTSIKSGLPLGMDTTCLKHRWSLQAMLLHGDNEKKSQRCVLRKQLSSIQYNTQYIPDVDNTCAFLHTYRPLAKSFITGRRLVNVRTGIKAKGSWKGRKGNYAPERGLLYLYTKL